MLNKTFSVTLRPTLYTVQGDNVDLELAFADIMSYAHTEGPTLSR